MNASEIPDALVEKAGSALRQHAHVGTEVDMEPYARAVLEAVWDDLPAARPVVTWRHARWFEPHEAVPVPGSEVERVRSTGMPGAECATCGEALNGWEAARPVVDRDALAEAIWDSTNDDPDLLWENVHNREYHDLADAILASGVVQDAADVRPVVDRNALGRALINFCAMGSALERADALLATGIFLDAADVRRATLEEAANDVPWHPQWVETTGASGYGNALARSVSARRDRD